MNIYISNSIRFIILAFIQVIVLNNLEIGGGMYIMVYPLFLFLLPMEWSTIYQMLIAFVFGLTIDSFSNTFGLHAGASVLFVYIKPMVLKINDIRDSDQEAVELLANGNRWFIFTFGTLLLAHHFAFFLVESFKLNEILLILKRVVLSLPVSIGVSILFKYFFAQRNLNAR